MRRVLPRRMGWVLVILMSGVGRVLSIPKIPSGRIRRDSERCDMIWIDDRDHESAVVDRWIAFQVA